MAVVTMRQLLESGVHFGHQTRRWNPKMKRHIFTERNGIYIVDLMQTLSYIDEAFEFVKETVSHGGTLLFVGTKKQAQESIREQATRVGMPYVNQRWLGGMLTNLQTVSSRVNRLKELEQIDFDDVAASGHTKKELLMMRREKDKLEKTLGGIRDMSRAPSAVWIVDTNKEHLAVDEAQKLNIPVVAILDTNCDPDEVSYPIPGNDDAIRSVTLLTRVLADAVASGLQERHSTSTRGERNVSAVDAEPLAEWEQELLKQSEVQQADAPAEKSVSADPATGPAAAEDPATGPAAAEDPATDPAAAEAAAADAAAANVVDEDIPEVEVPTAQGLAAEASTESDPPAAPEASAETESPAADLPATALPAENAPAAQAAREAEAEQESEEKAAAASDAE